MLWALFIYFLNKANSKYFPLYLRKCRGQKDASNHQAKIFILQKRLLEPRAHPQPARLSFLTPDSVLIPLSQETGRETIISVTFHPVCLVSMHAPPHKTEILFYCAIMDT